MRTIHRIWLCVAVGLLLTATLVTAESSKPETDASQDNLYADNNCVNCHRDLPGRLSEIVDLEWKHSVHYKAKVGCDGCHGGNATLNRDQFESTQAFTKAAHLDRNPEFLVIHRPEGEFVSAARGRSVSYFCGKCHDTIKEKHLGSPHGDFGEPTCLYCHGQGSHRIEDATATIIDTRPRSENGFCSPCHKQSTMEAVTQIKKVVVDTEMRIAESGQKYKQLEAMNYHNLELEQLHHHAAEVHSKLRQIFHSFNMRDVKNFASEIQDITDRTADTYKLITHLRTEQRQQTVVGVLAVVMLLIFAGLLVFYKKVFLESHGH